MKVRGMGEQSMEEKASCSSSATATATAPIPPQDDFSLFIHHFLHRSSSSSSSTSSLAQAQAAADPHHHLHPLFLPPPDIHRPPVHLLPAEDGISAGVGGQYLLSACAPHAPSSSLGASENETDEYDCESEEGLEALLEEIPQKPNPSRSSSKRSRTPEVHNLSEKRRRSRINEKMKALQSLIPNSNKTDKASMLDEAIDYLKQLQLQVQMLSMRNGMSLHPMCLPGALQPVHIPQMRALFGEDTESLHVNVAGNNLPISHEMSTQHAVFAPPNQHPTSTEPHLTSMFEAGSSFGLESPLQIHPGVYQLNSVAEEDCGEDMVSLGQSNAHASETHLFGESSRQMYQTKAAYEVGARARARARAAISLPLSSQPSNDLKISARNLSQG
ncbi:hypothetical protein SAY87_023979 [Trapa incisa]|uniref:BHLH domain-containing protein n=1 Tax=Trapa incisa TaxID=236973 RepID=A0AAN7L4D4_9MYRT|nr:hypothetical protein SAY87_023979 [Trapa incisa]